MRADRSLQFFEVAAGIRNVSYLLSLCSEGDSNQLRVPYSSFCPLKNLL